MSENVRENKTEETKKEVTNEMLMEEMKVIREVLGMILNNQANELRIRMNEAHEKGNDEDAAIYANAVFATFDVRDKVSGRHVKAEMKEMEGKSPIGDILKMILM